MKYEKRFEFLYPVTEFGVTPPAFVGNLQVKAVAYVDSEGFLMHENAFDFDDILLNDQSVFYLVQAISPDEFDNIKEATKNSARQFEAPTTSDKNLDRELSSLEYE